MGKANRLKRAAKKRRRTTPPRNTDLFGQHRPGCDCGDDWDLFEDEFWELPDEEDGVFDPPDAHEMADEILHYARQEASGHNTAALGAAELAYEGPPEYQRTVEIGVAIALASVLEQVWQSGWMPADLWHMAQRRAGASAAALLVDAIVADTERHAAATVHRRWADQVAWLGSGIWWDTSRPHLGQWAEREKVGVAEALLTAITTAAMLITLPALPRIVPPPGTAHHADTAAKSVDQRVLGRVRGLLPKRSQPSTRRKPRRSRRKRRS